MPKPGMPTIPIARPTMDQREADAATRAILSGWITQGPEVEAFEHEFAAAVGAPHACAVSNGTAALQLALLAADVGPGSEVVTVSHSHIATANSIHNCGALPVFVDVDSETFNMDPGLVERAIGPRTKAVLVVHQLGMPAPVGPIVEHCSPRGIAVIEDAACAIGSELRVDGRWERIGRPHSDAACFSFHPRKVLSTGDGGMITTANPKWDTLFRLWRQHGMSLGARSRHMSSQVTFESYERRGFNFRLTDIQAAVGRVQVERLDEIVKKRRELAARYTERLAEIPGADAPLEPSDARTNWQSYCLRLAEGLDQRTVMQKMLDAGVATRRGVMCAHREPAYADGGWRCGAPDCSESGKPCEHLVRSEQAQDSCIVLPLFDGMSLDEQDVVIATLVAAVR